MRDRARVLAPALAVLAAIALLGSLVGGYAWRALFDADQFADRATSALENEALSTEIATRVTDDLVLREQADLIGARPLIQEVVAGVIGSSAFREIFRAGASDLHRTVFEGDADTLTLLLADIGATARGAVEALAPQVAKKIPKGFDSDILGSDPPDVLLEAAKIGEDIRVGSLVLPVAALALAAAAFLLGTDRRRTALALGVSILASGVLAVVALALVHELVIGSIEESGPRDAADGIWDAFLGDLRTLLLLLAGAGAVVAAAASSLLRPVDIAAPLRRAWELVSTVPERPRMRALRAVLLLVAGILIVVRHELVIDLIAILAGLYVAYAGASELMRLTIAPPGERARAAATGRRAVLRVGAVTGAIVLVAGAAFAVGGGTTEDPAAEPDGCNGSPDLCERSFDEVAFPATHNSMSAATNPGWLFAQQERGLDDQLADGIRGLLIDAHYGVETADGTVKTDLSDLSNPERETYADAIGNKALDAALRIRDRIAGQATGERSIYLCHRFCELGALPLDHALGQIRDFLAANPREVIVVDVEDYVSPEDFAAVVESSGLIDHVYTGAVGSPWPTLGEIVESGGTALMLAENDAGGGSIPWYHQAYDELLQETPFSFKEPGLLTEAKNIPASCEPNRGPRRASLFLVNHWIDTSPAPRPSNAAKVNAHRPLLRRVTDCEDIRNLFANLIAVDFYGEGDVFGVAEALNARPVE